MMTIRTLFVLALVAFGECSALAEECHGPKDVPSPESPPKENMSPKPALTRGVVVGIKRDQKKVTLRHEEIKSPPMAAMTMNFTVTPGVMLDALNVKDVVLFSVVKENGILIIDHIEKDGGKTP